MTASSGHAKNCSPAQSPLLTFCLLACSATFWFVDDPATAQSLESLTFDCQLTANSVLRDKDGQMTAKTVDNDKTTLTFSGFDERTNHAMVVGNQGTTPVFFYDVGGHLQIIELTAELKTKALSEFDDRFCTVSPYTHHEN
jgi:hypothetical protein